MFLHRFKQCRLSFRRRPVDLVGQEHLAEDRAFLKDQFAVPGRRVLLNDVRAGDVGRHQVGRELDAAEAQVHRLSKRADHQRLGQAWHTLQQAVPA